MKSNLFCLLKDRLSKKNNIYCRVSVLTRFFELLNFHSRMKVSVSFFSLLFILACINPLSGQTCTPRSTLPTFCITTSEPVRSRDVYVNGVLQIVQDQGTQEELYNGGIRIRGRGNSTWGMAKKPYRINLNTAGSLLGMPATAKNWVLLANYADKTRIRNAVALEMSRYLGMPYASPFRFVDVILNGNYLGSYLLTDHMEVRENRIDIEEGQAENIPGAYMVEMDGFANTEEFYITTNQELKAVIKYPDLKVPQDQARVDDILAHINSFESRLFSGNPADGPGGFLERVDLQSLVNWYLGCEIAGNSDAFFSVYLHKKRSDDRLFMGPHWDFDIAFDNDNRISNARYRLMADVGHTSHHRKWIIQLRKDDVFMAAVKQKWNELKAGGFREHILDKLNEYADIMKSSGSLAADSTLYSTVFSTRVYREVFLSDSYQKYVNFLYDYLSQRIDWLDMELNGLSSGYNYKIINATSNKALTVSSPGTTVIQKTFVEQSDFLWQIRPLANGFYQIYNTGRNMVLTGGNSSGTNLTLSAVNPDDPLQQWRITQTSQSRHAIATRNERYGVRNKDNEFVDQIDYGNYGGEIQGWLNTSNSGKWTFSVVGGPLPVSLAYFGAEFKEGAVQLDWQVSEQVNGSHFEIERVATDKEKVTLGTVPLKEEKAGKYRWTDADPLPGLNYYRLKMVDLDGSATYSKIVSALNNRGGLTVKVYPNPAAYGVFVNLFVPAGGYAGLEIYNMIGLKVSEAKERVIAGTNHISLNTELLSPGMYILKVRNGNSSTETRFAITK